MAASVWKLTCKFLVVFALFLTVSSKGSRDEGVVSLDSKTWRDSMTGEWFVEFYAPWCPACQSFESKYEEFSKHASSYNVKVAKIDITENPALSGRFLVTSLPTIFYIRDGVTRFYDGARSLQELLNYLRNEQWKAVEPVKWYKAPDSFSMTIVSWFFELSVIIRQLHEMMTQEFNIPVWGSYIIFAIFTLIAGLALGMVLVLLCDCCCPPRPQYVRPTSSPDKYDKIGDDSDIIDDTDTKDEDADESSDADDTSSVRKRKPRRDT